MTLIIKSLAKLIEYPQYFPIAPISDRERCGLCGVKVPENTSVIRHRGTDEILCLDCIAGVKEVIDANSTKL